MPTRPAAVRLLIGILVPAVIAGLGALAASPADGAEEEPDEQSTELPEHGDAAAPSSHGSATPAATASANSDDTYRAALAALSAVGGGPHTLNITGSFTLEDDGDPLYTGTQDLTVNGNGFTIDGGGFSTILVFNPTSDALLTVNDLTFTNGDSAPDGGALDVESGGGAQVNNSNFLDNETDDDGGAIDVDPDGITLGVNGGTFDDNVANRDGGAIYVDAESTGIDVLIDGATFEANSTDEDDGGAINHDSGGGSLTIRNSTFVQNQSDDVGGAINADFGVPITIENSTFDRNTAVRDDAGAIDTGEDTTITRSTFSGNRTLNGDGGAIDSSAEGVTRLDVIDSTFTANAAFQPEAPYASGGGISLEPANVTTIDGSTFSGNEAEEGGAIDLLGSATITNSTLTGNVAEDEGGGVYTTNLPDELTLIHVTMSGNSAPEGANVFTEAGDVMNTFATVFADPQGGGDNCDLNAATVNSTGWNWSTDDSCDLGDPTDTENGADPQLEALGDFGGLTQTMPPVIGSPLIDAIPESDDDTAVDQRDVARPQDGDLDGTLAFDIGAVEVLVEAPGEGPVAAAPPFTG